MPRPPDNLCQISSLLQSIDKSIQKERLIAEERHKEVLSKIRDRYSVFKDEVKKEQLLEIRARDPCLQCYNGYSGSGYSLNVVGGDNLFNSDPLYFGKGNGTSESQHSQSNHMGQSTEDSLSPKREASSWKSSDDDNRPSGVFHPSSSELMPPDSAKKKQKPMKTASDNPMKQHSYQKSDVSSQGGMSSLAMMSKKSFGGTGSKICIRKQSITESTSLQGANGEFRPYSFLKGLVRDERFEIIVAVFILANAFSLCAEVQYEGIDIGWKLHYPGYVGEAREEWPSGGSVFVVTEWFFGILFSLEIVVKVVFIGRKYFYDGWSHLDCLCVLAFIIDKVGESIVPVDGKGVRLLRLMRLARLVRLLRFLESLDVLYIMTTAFMGMMRIVFWAIMLLTVMLMTIALLVSQILHTYHFTDEALSSLSGEKLKKYHELFEYFGTLTRCLLSMFEMTLANWPIPTRLLSENVSEWFVLFCLFHKLIIGFAVIAVINGVILQETFKVAATDDLIMVRQKQRALAATAAKMVNLFEALDSSRDGNLSFDEFQSMFDIPEVKIWLASMDIETEEGDLRTLFDLLDDNSSGEISMEEFVRRIPRIMGSARSIDMLALCQSLNIKGDVRIGGKPKERDKYVYGLAVPP